MKKRIAILTGGGDVPGLNAAIKSFVWRLSEDDDVEILGLRRGWASLINIVPEDGADNSSWITYLTRANTRAIDRTGGTILHTSRVNPEITKRDAVPPHLRDAVAPDERGRYDLTSFAVRTIDYLKLDAVVALGGDGTLSFARVLQERGVPLVFIPKTMDNDVYGTDYCLGFSTAVTRSVMFINDLRTGAASHERFLIVELFGRYSGETCLLASYLAGVDRALIAEVPFDCERLWTMLAQDKADNPMNYAVVAVSEGATVIGGATVESGEADAFGNRKLGGIGSLVSDYLEKRSRDKVIYQRLAYLMRSGDPDSLDQLVANNYGSLAADLLRRGDRGKMVAVVDGRYTAVPLESSGEAKKRVDIERFYDAVEYRPKVADVMGMPMFLH